MDHVVYLEAKEKELDKLKSGQKSMIIRGAAGRKLPHGRVHPGEVLWFVENSGDGLVRCRATVKNVFNSEKLSEQESQKLISDNQTMLCLTPMDMSRPLLSTAPFRAYTESHPQKRVNQDQS